MHPVHRNQKDYSIGEVLQPDGRYAMYYEGGEKIIFSPNEELVKVLKRRFLKLSRW